MIKGLHSCCFVILLWNCLYQEPSGNLELNDCVGFRIMS